MLCLELVGNEVVDSCPLRSCQARAGASPGITVSSIAYKGAST